jgi:putative intracellular protease/amidase
VGGNCLRQHEGRARDARSKETPYSPGTRPRLHARLGRHRVPCKPRDAGRTVTGFANAEENFSDTFAGQQVMPWRVEDVLKDRGANYVQGGLFKAFAVRDGRLITGQQQYSGRKVAQMVIEALGV